MTQKPKNEKTTSTNKKDDFQVVAVRQKIIRMNPMALVSMFMENNEIKVMKGVPAGSRYIGSGYDASTHTFFVNIENDSWPEVTVGDKLDMVDVSLKDIRGEK